MICILLLAFSTYLNIEMYLITLLSAIVLTICIIIFSKRREGVLTSVYKRIPYNLILFILSMYTLVIALNHNGVTQKISQLISNIAVDNNSAIVVYGSLSTIFDNLVNNIPMSMLFSSIILNNFSNGALYATIIGSNVGAYLTPLASLAGIMWMFMLKKENVDFSFGKFLKYGIVLTPLILIASLSGLIILL